MEKNKKVGILAGVIIILIIGAVALGVNGRDKGNTNTNNNQTSSTSGAGAAKDGADNATNYWDNVDVIEDGDKQETKTKKNGEVVTEEPETDKDGKEVTEAYPGQNDGWSPIVSPDDLEEDKK